MSRDIVDDLALATMFVLVCASVAVASAVG
jgi:hypothetical protein